jgi:hypothetical protein
VKGMPDVKGQPAEEFAEKYGKAQINRIVAALPKGYGHQFGSSLWKVMTAQWKNMNPSDLEDAIQMAVAKLVQKKSAPDEGTPLRQAEGWAKKVVSRTLIDLFRSKGRRQEQSIIDEEGEVMIDLSDPRSFREMDNKLLPKQLQKMMRELRNVDTKFPDRAPSWVRMHLDKGSKVKNVEMGEEWGVTQQAAGNWIRKHEGDIKSVLWKHLSHAAA